MPIIDDRKPYNPFPAPSTTDRAIAGTWMDYHVIRAALETEGLAIPHVAAIDGAMGAWSRGASLAAVSSLVRGLAAWRPRAPHAAVLPGAQEESARVQARIKRAWTLFLSFVERELPDHVPRVLAARGAYRAARERVRVTRSGLARRA